MSDNIAKILDKVRIQKVVVTRSIKTSRGDFFVGFSAAWDSVQDDSMHSIESCMDDDAHDISGMTVSEARLATLALGMQVDLAAITNAHTGCGLNDEEARSLLTTTKDRYSKRIDAVVKQRAELAQKTVSEDQNPPT